MPKILKAKRRKAKAKAKAKRKPITRTKAKTQKINQKKKTKIKVATMQVTRSLKVPDKVKGDVPLTATEQMHVTAAEKNNQREHELPKISYKLEVDGRLKSEHPTEEAALTAALELKRKFPHIRVAIVDTKGSKRIAVELPQA
jgi:recombination DNA repair RAD52 pathway protein